MTHIKLLDRIFPALAGDALRSSRERSLRLVMLTAVSFGALVHIFSLVIFQATQLAALSIVNACALLPYGVAYLLVVKTKFAAAGAMITLDVLIYTGMFVWLAGADTYPVFYLFIALIMQLTIPYAGSRVRGAFSAAIWAATLAVALIDFRHTPVLDATEARLPLTIFNVHVGIVGCLAELTIGGISRRIVDHYSAARLEELKSQAHTDSLTGLYNRRFANLLFDSIAGGKAGRSWCVAMADIDDFKRINDHCGHSAGDRVLVGVASRMRHMLRRTDVIFRWGGEEFLLLLEDVDAGTAAGILDKLRESVAEMDILTERGAIRVTLTIGVAALNIRDIMGSIVECDKKMYSGKTTGKNRVMV